MNIFMEKVSLMVKLKERIYSIKNDTTKKDELQALIKLLNRIQRNPDKKSI